MSQKVSSDFVTAIVEGKDPTTTIKESKKKEAPVPSPQSEIIEEEVRTVKQCVIEFKLLMAQARGLLEEMTTVGAGIGAGPPTKKKKKSTVEIIKKYGEKYLIEKVSKAPSEDIWYFINEKLENEWCEYHLKEATLRLLCISCHNKETYKKKVA